MKILFGNFRGTARRGKYEEAYHRRFGAGIMGNRAQFADLLHPIPIANERGVSSGSQEVAQEDGCEKGREENLLTHDDAGSPAYLKLLQDMADLHRRKNAGYAGGKSDPWDNFRECEDFGLGAYVGVLVRMGDKWKRIKSLQRNAANELVGESKRDTLMDLAAYALIAVCLLDEEKIRQ